MSDEQDKIESEVSSFVKRIGYLIGVIVAAKVGSKTFEAARIALLRSVPTAKTRVVKRTDNLLVSSFKEGLSDANVALKPLVGDKLIKVVSDTQKMELQFLRTKTANDISAAFNNFGNTVSAFLSKLRATEAQKEAITSAIAEGIENNFSISTSTSRVMEILKEELTSGVTTAGMRKVSLESYANMIARTLPSIANSRAIELRCIQNGVYHVQITSSQSQDWCKFFEGKVFSLVENDSFGYPHISQIPNGGTPFHPYCRHREVPFLVEQYSKKALDATIIDPKFATPNVKQLRVLEQFELSS